MPSGTHRGNDSWVIQLYVVGDTPRSRAALRNLQAICAALLSESRCSIEVTDLREHPEAWREHQILATPTAVRRYPLPERRVIGDLSQTDQVIAGLGLPHPPEDRGGQSRVEPAGEGGVRR
jgi:circadian clock protein KaiB